MLSMYSFIYAVKGATNEFLVFQISKFYLNLVLSVTH